MLNAYSRVDKGRLFALDRRSDDKSAFGSHISDTFELFKNLQKSANDDDRMEKNDNSNSGFFQGKQGQGPTAAPSKSKSGEDITDSFVTVSNTLLSNLLINSVLSALKTGNSIMSSCQLFCTVMCIALLHFTFKSPNILCNISTILLCNIL